MSKVAVYAIAKNEQHNVDAFVKQTQMFDHVVVLDTGSMDHTVHVLQSHGIQVASQCIQPFDFAQAKNMCAALVPEDCEWLVSVDFSDQFNMDDSLLDSIRASTCDALTVNYLSSMDASYCENKIKIHKRGKFHWKHAVHEYLVPSCDNPQVEHLDWNMTKLVNQNLNKQKFYFEICERAHAALPQEPHYSWWSLSYLRTIENWPKLRYYAEHYLNHTIPYTLDFRVWAWLYLSEYWEPVDWDRAVDCALKALAESLDFKHINPQLWIKCQNRMMALGVSFNMRPM